MDIQKILNELNKSMTDARIGAVIGLSQPTVNRLRNGHLKKTTQAVELMELAKSKGIKV